MKVIAQHIVSKIANKTRLSEYCRGLFEALPSRKSIKKAIKEGRILLNEQQGNTGDWIEEGMKIQLLAPEKIKGKVYNLALEVLYEDDYLALINKPAGIPVSGNQFRTIFNALPNNLSLSTKVDALLQAHPVHRLDSPTSGILLVAKTAGAELSLSQQFAERKIEKKYEAILSGKAPLEGLIEIAIEEKQAQTQYECLSYSPSLINENLSWVRFFPKTGRTHQIRIHAAGMGCPIMGDKRYGVPGKVYKGKGLFLCATGLSFYHPGKEEWMHFSIKAPNKFQRLIDREAQMWRKYHQQ